MLGQQAPCASSITSKSPHSQAITAPQETRSYGLADPRDLICFLQDANVRRVRLEYLIELRESGRPFPRRQEAETETTASGAPALVDAKELTELRINNVTGHVSTMIRHPTPRAVSVHFVSVSHVWESKQHPDPWRFQLDAIVDAYRPRLLDSLVWIFFDYVSLHQYVRDDHQQKLFKQALNDMHILYAHEAIEVHRITLLTPKSVRDGCAFANRWRIPVYWQDEAKVMPVPIYQLELNATPYDERGWCQAETQWAALRAGLKEGNPFPLPPAVFRARMSQLKFTHRDDADSVFKLQAKIFQEKASSTTTLLVEDLDAEKCADLIAALPSYTKLKELVASSSPAYAWKLPSAVVQSGACKIQIECTSIADEDAISLASDLSSEACLHLQSLHLKCDALGELGRNAFQRMRTHRQKVSGSSFDLLIKALTPSRGCIRQEVEPQPCATLRILVSQRKRLDRSQCPAAVTTQKLGAGCAAMALQRVLKGELLTDTDACAMDEIVAVKFRNNQSLEAVQLPANIQTVTFGENFNQSLEAVQLPANLQTLTFGNRFNQSLEGVQLPANLQTLTFGENFNQSLEGVQLPANLQTLTFGYQFNQSLEGVQLPANLQTLTFGNRFNQSLEGVQLPADLQTLTFGIEFNQSLEAVQLPADLQTLTFGENFNQSLEGVQLPANLQTLTFGENFNQSLEGVQLPANLQTLTFGNRFNQSLEAVQLPADLQTLTFGFKFNQSLEAVQLPATLETSTFGKWFDQSLEAVQLPADLQSLTFGNRFNQSLEGVQLPANLQTLTFGKWFNQSLEGVQLPANLQSLTFGFEFNQSLEGVQLPANLQTLTFGENFNQSLEAVQLPATLETLTFGENFNQSLEGVQLPANLQSLTFGFEFNQSLEAVQLPANLQSLTFGFEFNQSLEGVQLPANLQTLTFGGEFNQSLEAVQLPANLQTLTFGFEFNQSLEAVLFPHSLRCFTSKSLQVDTC